jgi:hypothetical protein
VTIANTDVTLMEWLAQFGAHVHWDNKRRQPHYKRRAVWVVAQALDCFRLLVAIEPYLSVKRAKAQEAIDALRAARGFAVA